MLGPTLYCVEPGQIHDMIGGAEESLLGTKIGEDHSPKGPSKPKPRGLIRDVALSRGV
jgi:hypothetical protein